MVSRSCNLWTLFQRVEMHVVAVLEVITLWTLFERVEIVFVNIESCLLWWNHFLCCFQTSYNIPNDPVNPYRGRKDPPVCAHLTRTGGLQPTTTITAHSYAINSVAVHPTKEVLVTASDDHTWKMWAFPRYITCSNVVLENMYIHVHVYMK